MKRYKMAAIIGVLLTSLITLFSIFYFYYRENYMIKPHVSIIIPVYNTEKYLDECLNSARCQTLREIEIICVNDESEDSSLKILKSHRRKDRRIKIVNQKHAGISIARNNGLNKARGEYIFFLDSDDVIFPNACECAYKNAIDTESDLVEFNIAKFEDGQKLDFSKFECNESNFEVVQREESENPFKTLKLNSDVVWNKLWKRSFIQENNLSFKEGLPCGEDYLFNWLSLPLLHKAVKNENVFYGYRIKRPGSISSNSTCVKVLNSVLIIIDEIFKNHDRFKFDGGEAWTIDVSLAITYDRITKELQDQNDKIYFSQKVLSLLDAYINKYGLSPSSESQKRIDVLRDISNV